MGTDEKASKGNGHPFRECSRMFEAMSRFSKGKEGLAKCCSGMEAMMEIMRDKTKSQGDREKTEKE